MGDYHTLRDAQVLGTDTLVDILVNRFSSHTLAHIRNVQDVCLHMPTQKADEDMMRDHVV